MPEDEKKKHLGTVSSSGKPQRHKKINLGSTVGLPMLITRREASLDEEDLMEKVGQLVEVNTEMERKADITMLPSIHNMVNSSYSVISNEIGRLNLRSRNVPLSATEVRNFEKLTSSLVKLAQLEMNVREESSLEMESDEKILELVDKATERMQEKSNPRGKK